LSISKVLIRIDVTDMRFIITIDGYGALPAIQGVINGGMVPMASIKIDIIKIMGSGNAEMRVIVGVHGDITVIAQRG